MTLDRHGPAAGPTVLVLDPAGLADHGSLPVTWRPLADDWEKVRAQVAEALRRARETS
ncbi:MAG TPA: hypothetical protein VL652_28050 [Kutzneria sp.]|nr:hypothetical protein [Kutzneria sp.]